MSSLTVVAATHQRASFATLERVALDQVAAQTLGRAVHAVDRVDEVVVLSTCNRTEVYISGTADAADAVVRLLAAQSELPADALREGLLIVEGEEASTHLFRVAAGLESRIVGEHQILRQVRAAAVDAAEAGTAGPELQSLFRWAAATSRRARRSTNQLPPSLARTALDAAEQGSGVRSTLVLGSGAMAAAITSELTARRVPYRVCARRPDHARRLARRPQDAVPFSALGSELVRSDLVICATGARSHLVSEQTVATAVAARQNVPLTILDLSMPRNVAPGVAAIDGVVLMDLEHLTSDDDGLDVHRVARIVASEHECYRTWLAGREAGPLIGALRRRVTDACRSELHRIVGADLEPDAIERIASAIAGKVAHTPVVTVKALTVRGDDDAVAAIAAAFGITSERPRPVQTA